MSYFNTIPLWDSAPVLYAAVIFDSVYVMASKLLVVLNMWKNLTHISLSFCNAFLQMSKQRTE